MDNLTHIVSHESSLYSIDDEKARSSDRPASQISRVPIYRSLCHFVARQQVIIGLKLAGLLHKPGTYLWPWNRNRNIVVKITDSACLPEVTTENNATCIPQLIVGFYYKGRRYTVTRHRCELK